MPADTSSSRERPPQAGGAPTSAFNVYTSEPAGGAVPPAAQLGLEPPRYCADCGRRMTVQVRPDGWSAKCSRHGVLDSADLKTKR